MNNTDLIQHFYTAFQSGDIESMVACYHDDAEFSDPAFGPLKGEEVRNMWRMLHLRSGGNLDVTFGNVRPAGEGVQADWEARYLFSKSGRKVHNVIRASFLFRDGKIIRHQDRFDFWRWSRMALGFPGLLLGWTPFLRKKVRNEALAGLRRFSGGKL